MILFLCLVAALVLLVEWRASARERQAATDYPPSGEIVNVDGVPVHVKISGSGPDLVLIHGASGNLRDFTFDLAGRLSDRYRVIAFDRPGLGWTGRLPGYGGAWNSRAEPPQAQAALLQNAADMIGVDRPIVLGHSFGGAVALAWGLSRPDDTAALVLVSSVSEPWPGDLGWLYRVTGSALGSATVIPLITAFLPRSYVENSIGAIFAPQDPPAGYAAHVGAALTLRRTSMRSNAQQVDQLRPHIVEMAAQYDTLTMPVEMVHGDADTIVPMHIHAEVLLDDLPEGVGQLTRLSGMGHMPHHIDPQATVDAIDRAAARAGLR